MHTHTHMQRSHARAFAHAHAHARARASASAHVYGECTAEGLLRYGVRTYSDGYEEDGIDEGGLTTELHALFWREAAQPEALLFEGGDGGGGSDGGGGGGGGVLPHADANEEAMVGVGLMACKGVIADHPVGALLTPFVFEYLVHGDAAPALRDVRAALAALRGFDAPLASQWYALLPHDGPTLTYPNLP